MTHLVLHKVRGEPAFDVAEQMEVGDEVWWIIPTSGHRAYPFKSWPLEGVTFLALSQEAPLVPEDWPDHYSAPDGNVIEPKINIGSLLSKLVPKIKRRI
jgi:hypothetical protein